MFGSRNRYESSLGSGVVISADGYVLTNSHVVGEGEVEVTVGLGDKRELRAKVIGVDPSTDLALLKVEARNLPTIPWGDSARLKVAEWVLAIGSPFQLNQTVTLGIVSALGRANVGIAAYEDFIQTDAAINPGNSGGALINARGELIGINTAIFSQSGGYQGIGFAVPSNLARRVVDDLTKFGVVRRGSIGYLEVTPLTSRLADELRAPTTEGLVVMRMTRGAAYQAGLRPGDVILSVNGPAGDRRRRVHARGRRRRRRQHDDARSPARRRAPDRARAGAAGSAAAHRALNAATPPSRPAQGPLGTRRLTGTGHVPAESNTRRLALVHSPYESCEPSGAGWPEGWRYRSSWDWPDSPWRTGGPTTTARRSAPWCPSIRCARSSTATTAPPRSSPSTSWRRRCPAPGRCWCGCGPRR